jgi:hypothetical protein
VAQLLVLVPPVWVLASVLLQVELLRQLSALLVVASGFVAGLVCGHACCALVLLVSQSLPATFPVLPWVSRQVWLPVSVPELARVWAPLQRRMAVAPAPQSLLQPN